MAIKRFEEIESWQMARKLTNAVYAIWNRDGAPRDFVLRDQMIRAATSVMHNIAEGFDAGTNAEFIRFLGYAKRSCTEVQSELYVGLDQRYYPKSLFDELYEARGVREPKLAR